MNKDMFLDEVCSEIAKSIEHSTVRQIAEEKVLHCNCCDFLAVIRIVPFDVEWARSIIRRLELVLGVLFSVISDFATERGHYFEFDLSDREISEDFLLRLACIISNVLMVKKDSDGYLTLDICRHKRNKRGFISVYYDFATDCSPLLACRLAEFLKLFAEAKVTMGCIKVLGVDVDWKCKE